MTNGPPPEVVKEWEEELEREAQEMTEEYVRYFLGKAAEGKDTGTEPEKEKHERD